MTRYFLCRSAASLQGVLFSAVRFPPLVSWLVAFYKMLSVLTSKLRARLNNCHIAPHHPAWSVASSELKAVATLVSRPASVSVSLPGCDWPPYHRTEQKSPSSSDLCIKQENDQFYFHMGVHFNCFSSSILSTVHKRSSLCAALSLGLR